MAFIKLRNVIIVRPGGLERRPKQQFACQLAPRFFRVHVLRSCPVMNTKFTELGLVFENLGHESNDRGRVTDHSKVFSFDLRLRRPGTCYKFFGPLNRTRFSSCKIHLYYEQLAARVPSICKFPAKCDWQMKSVFSIKLSLSP